MLSIFQPNIEKLASRKDIEGLAKAAENRDPAVRRKAIAALGELGDERAVPFLNEAIGDEKSEVRLEAVLASGKLKSRNSMDALAEAALHDSEPIVRLNAVWALGEIGDESVLRTVILAMGDPEPTVREKAVLTAAQFGRGAIKELKNAAQGGNPAIRRNAISALGRIGDPEPVPLIIRALSDPDPSVRRNAIWALGRLADPRAVPVLERIHSERAASALKSIKEGPQWRTVAENYEAAGRYEDAADLYEIHGDFEEAGRLRNRARAPTQSAYTPAPIMAENINLSSETVIRDSIINRSHISGGKIEESVVNRAAIGRRNAGTQAKIKVCPYCGRELNFARTPRFCPYCAERLI